MRNSKMKNRKRVSGSALVELVLLLPLLILMSLGTIDFGRLFYYAVTVAHTARAGVQYGVQGTPQAGDTSTVIQSAMDDAGDIGQVGVTTGRYCKCPDGSIVNCTATGGGAFCSSGVPSVYVWVTAQKTFTTIVNWPGIPSTVNLSQTAVMRVH